ncbi:DUF3958 family protein [Enterococcus caccae]|uniref:Uncharacterized protein n=1 Tax=Enterococcus caccae ATCC BAA-1240 TaxID=1158612 RepID=R3TXZ6_9ENTE|nr:DUF3958 family protein [Enterococcus caccae]EOL46459.1 hypothetical protein UC7_01426 [Enterococcus caccae ATCC BAA-1240]EOT60828.1 hypothetical protein I580_01728 [Enterococcus caccae ATCC BAA-1240]OJG26154.1 hypothetical protein RU98_GL000656 [Enterococcus caccae]
MIKEKERIINQRLQQISIDQEEKRQEICELEELEADYFSIHYQEQRYYQELIGNNQGSQFIDYFMELDDQANRLHQYERQRLEDIAERLVDEEVQLRDRKEALFLERTRLFADKTVVEENCYGY